MKTLGRATAHLIEAAMLGGAAAFLVAVGILTMALVTGYAAVPGVLAAWTESSAQGGSIVLDPTWTGILTLAAVAAVVCIVVRVWARRRASVLA